MPGATAGALSPLPPKALPLPRASPDQESPISPLVRAGEGQAQGDASRDSPLILAKLLQSPAAHTQARLAQRLVKLNQPRRWHRAHLYHKARLPPLDFQSLFPSMEALDLSKERIS